LPKSRYPELEEPTPAEARAAVSAAATVRARVGIDAVSES
jgi:hypothetical protein